MARFVDAVGVFVDEALLFVDGPAGAGVPATDRTQVTVVAPAQSTIAVVAPASSVATVAAPQGET